jgi:pilus assembly protein Flp/PilA
LPIIASRDHRKRFQEIFVKQIFVKLLNDERGQDLVEYALIVAAVGLALITTVNQLSTAVVSLYSSITQGLASIGTSGQ